MAFSDILKSLFGNKSDRDLKKLKPIVEKIKAAYPEIEQLSNDGLISSWRRLLPVIFSIISGRPTVTAPVS